MPAKQNVVNDWQLPLTASGSPSLLVNNIPASVSSIKIVYQNVVPSTGTPFPLIQVSTNNGSSFISSGYQSGLNYAAYNTAPTAGQNATNGFLIGFQTPSTGYISGELTLYNINSPGSSMMSGTGVLWNGGGLFCFFGGILNGTANANAFQIVMSSGNISTGTFKIYGLN